jgi:hypothetical protein
MKKIFLVLLISLIILGCTTTEQLVMKPLYSISEKYYEDIKGNFTIQTLLVFKKVTVGTNAAITIDKIIAQNDTSFVITLHYIGPDWKYFEAIEIKIDDNYYKLIDSEPSRYVNSGSNVTITEVINPHLNEVLIESLLNSKKIIIQYDTSPIDIPPEAIMAIKNFIK